MTAQVLGLTNYSHWDKAAEMRSCMLRHDDIAGEQAGWCLSTAAPCRESVGDATGSLLGSRDRGATVSMLGLLFTCQLTGLVGAGLAAGCRQFMTTVGCKARGELPCDIPFFVLLLSVPAEELLEFGLKRIEKFEHIGTTEKLYPSVEAAAASLKMPLGSTAYGAGEVGRVRAWHSSSVCCVVCCRVCAVAVCVVLLCTGVHVGPAAGTACRG